VTSPDPLAALHVAVNRRLFDVEGAPALGADQALALPVALAGYTAGSAYVNGVERRTGSIAVGLEADLVVLDRDPFAEPAEIGAARVQRTYVGGVLVHHND
jgi:predicted amidohydrolase YtcJ